MTQRLEHVPPAFVDQAWRDGAYRLAMACETSGGEITGDQLKMILSRGERLLFVVLDGQEKVGWLVMRVDQLPNLRALHICELYAPGATFDACWKQIQDFARANGCSEIRASAGEAQARLYRMKWKFEPVYTTLRVKL